MRRWLPHVLLALMIGSLAAAGLTVMQWRFASGDAYPRGSSLRTDPKGTKALHESYDLLPDIDAARNFTPFREMQRIPPDSTLLVIGASGFGMFPLATQDAVTRFVAEGGRLVIALDANRVAYKHIDETNGDTNPESQGEDADSNDNRDRERRIPDNTWSPSPGMSPLWDGLRLEHGEHTGGTAMATATARAGSPVSIPPASRRRKRSF